jgi:hypothetical protein
MGERLVELADRVATPQNMMDTEIVHPTTFRNAFFLAVVDHLDLRRHTVSLLLLRPFSVMRSS